MGIDVLLEPPTSYISTSVDLLQGIERIRSKAAEKLYASQYDFDNDLRYVVSRANDGHLGLELCSLSVMHFEHGVPLVSISSDGLELPRIYTHGIFFGLACSTAGAANAPSSVISRCYVDGKRSL